MENQFLLLPGPTQIPNRVLQAANQPMISHRSGTFKDIFGQVTENAKRIFCTKNDLLILTCSGTAGLEASVVNFLNSGDKVIVASTGNFGRRYRDIAEAHGMDIDYIEFPMGKAVDPAVIAEKLAADTEQKIKAIIIQQHETSTGVYNPLDKISAARGNHPALLLVDAVSGLGACPLKTDEWGLDVVVTSSQKALMVPPGLCLVTVSQRAWAAAANNHNHKFYLDLSKAKKYADDRQTPFTPAVSLVYALDEAVNMLNEQGIDNVIAEHYFRRDAIRASIKALGLKPVADDQVAGGAVTAVYCPEGITAAEITGIMREKYDTVIAGGMGDIKKTSFRIAHLGFVRDMDLIAAIGALELALYELGYKFELGTGVGACQKVIIEKRKVFTDRD